MKRSIIAAAVFSSFFMSAGVFAADVDTGTLTIKGNIAESPCKFEAGGDSVSINMPTVPTSVFEGKAKEGANKRGNSSRLTQSFHFFMFESIFSPVNALN
ncbi:hypothetical protein ODQ82_18930, partial [Escherichia coli]|nr:hypothetical protein [Escherichia coli]